MSIVDQLLHLFPDTITGQPGVLDSFGTWIASGAQVTLPARYEGGPRVVRTPQGQDQVSTLSAIVGGVGGFNPDTWRFTIPSRFTPHANLIAINVLKESDATQVVYEEVIFP